MDLTAGITSDMSEWEDSQVEIVDDKVLESEFLEMKAEIEGLFGPGSTEIEEVEHPYEYKPFLKAEPGSLKDFYNKFCIQDGSLKKIESVGSKFYQFFEENGYKSDSVKHWTTFHKIWLDWQDEKKKIKLLSAEDFFETPQRINYDGMLHQYMQDLAREYEWTLFNHIVDAHELRKELLEQQMQLNFFRHGKFTSFFPKFRTQKQIIRWNNGQTSLMIQKHRCFCFTAAILKPGLVKINLHVHPAIKIIREQDLVDCFTSLETFWEFYQT